MDPLALLSNLHGDGPATLQRLRRYGCDTLSGLLASPAGELAPILGWDVVRAERFLREANVLLARVGGGLLDVEEDAPEPIAPEPRRTLHVLSDDDEDVEGALNGAADAREPDEPGRRRATDRALEPAAAQVLDAEAPVEADDEVDDETDLQGSDGDGDEADEEPEGEAIDTPLSARVREEVLTRWRTLDAAEPATREETLVPHTPSRSPAAPGRPLTSSGIDGLDPIRLRALLRAGVATVEELAAADPFALHQRSGLPFTLTSRLGFLARRTAAKAPPLPVRTTFGRDGAGGPFA